MAAKNWEIEELNGPERPRGETKKMKWMVDAYIGILIVGYVQQALRLLGYINTR